MTTIEQPFQTETVSLRALQWAKRWALSQETVLLIITIVAIAVLSTRNERFLTQRNLEKEAVLLFEVGLMALPMTYIIITGGIDLSVGSIFGMSAIILGFMWQDYGWPIESAIVAAMVVGTLGGLLNGLFIVRLGVPPLITTLATLAFYRGVALGISEARSARGFPKEFYQIGRGRFDVTIPYLAKLDYPNQIWVLAMAVIITGVILSRTSFGRSLYAIGNNELATRFAGIRVNRNKLLIYTFSGFMCGVASVFFVSRVTTTRSDMGTGMELDVIAAVVLGGTSIFGGSGSVVGTLLGVILIAALKNGLLLAGQKGDAAQVMVGAVLIAAILINNTIQRTLKR
jgi:rhamnose transport system permease protein